MGSVMISPSRESNIVSPLFTKTSINDYEKLCITDVLGLKESHNKRDDYIEVLKHLLMIMGSCVLLMS